jgi:hypothetical protein
LVQAACNRVLLLLEDFSLKKVDIRVKIHPLSAALQRRGTLTVRNIFKELQKGP